jgi:hypothetical protein
VLRGKVVAEVLSGLPGQGLEGMLVTVHASEGTPVLDRMPESLAETITDAQGAFVLSTVLREGTYIVAVRRAADQPALAVQQVVVDERESQGELLLRVPVDP